MIANTIPPIVTEVPTPLIAELGTIDVAALTEHIDPEALAAEQAAYKQALAIEAELAGEDANIPDSGITAA